MSKSYRHEKTEPRERDFPYIPTGVPVVSTGRAYGADDNCAVVRAMVRKHQPELADAIDLVDTEWSLQALTLNIIEIERRIRRLRLITEEGR